MTSTHTHTIARLAGNISKRFFDPALAISHYIEKAKVDPREFLALGEVPVLVSKPNESQVNERQPPTAAQIEVFRKDCLGSGSVFNNRKDGFPICSSTTAYGKGFTSEIMVGTSTTPGENIASCPKGTAPVVSVLFENIQTNDGSFISPDISNATFLPRPVAERKTSKGTLLHFTGDGVELGESITMTGLNQPVELETRTDCSVSR